ncbi:MAG TPA: LamG-like jellyroll fold domain-containing protein [Verrucomicrobiae bacterium]|jgi:hypothetical protein|nr:LamG-like jellyroll fold domain-containing protein [Verrucomicrobiae bacterium]
MKQLKTPGKLAAHILQLMAIGIIVVMGFAPPARAGLTGPYTNDFYTLHLWHLQDTSGTITGVATNGVFEFDYATNALVVPLLVSNTPGPNLIGGTGTTAYSQAGQPGPGTGPLFAIIGTNFGYALSVQTTQNTAFFAPWDDINNVDYPDLSYAVTNNSCSFVNTNTGAFTWEALIQPAFNPLTFTADRNPEIMCSDGPNDSGPGANPYTERAVQFRLDNATPSSGQAELEFNGNISGVPSTLTQIHDAVGIIPSTGPDAVAQGNWYHIAAAFTGNAPTNGDPPGVLTLYWTKFDPTRTNADVLTNLYNFYSITNATTHSSIFFPYPSNSIVGTGPFVIGNSARLATGGGLAGGFIGNIAEVRISDCYRHPNEFMFNNSSVGLPPFVTGPTTNNLIGYGQNLNLNVQVSGTQPYAYQWYQSGVPMDGQTNAVLVVSNIPYAANSEVFYAIITNAYGSATSAVATVTVGATFDTFFNTGCGPNYNPLDQTAPGSIDLHWTIPQNPDNNSSNAIVWSDGSPLASGGGVGPDNGSAVWVGPHENRSTVSGVYAFQTAFQVDETAVTGSNGISGTVGALGAAGGTVMQMSLNGVETDVTLSGNPAENVYAFSITNGLQPGSNILVCTAAQTGSGTAGNNAFILNVLSDTGAALTNAPFITNAPVSVTNVFGSTVSFSAVALGAPPLSWYWLSNGVAITPPVWVFTAPASLSFVATNFSPSELAGTNFIANYQIVFSNFVGSVTSDVATLDVQVPPLTVVSAGLPIWDQTNSETNIVVYFSGAVDPVTATTAGNYTLNGATVVSATLGGAPGEVILTTGTALVPGTSYTLTVQNVNSAFGIEMNPSPASISVGTYPATVALWLKAGQGVIAGGGGSVSQWNDLSGNGNNLIAGGNSPQLLTNAINGQPMVEFTGTNGTYLYANDAPSLEITGDMSIFAVMNFATLAGGTNGDIISKVNGNNQPAPYDYYAQPASVHFLRGNGSVNAAANSTAGPVTGIPHILDVVMRGTSVTHRLDGNPNGSGTLSTTIADSGHPLSIGAREDFGNFLTGGMAELILVGQALSSSDVASMEKYLATEYNLGLQINTHATNIVVSLANNQLTLSWPADHTGWQLQAQTNSASVGLGTNWFNVNNTAGTNAIVVPINLTNGTVFYRLVYP